MTGEGHPEARVIVCSDRAASQEREDATAPRLVETLHAHGFACELATVRIVPDDREAIAACLQECVREAGVRLVVTTGGTGVAARDVTPEATRAVIEREIPGFGEAMRAASLSKTPYAVVSRAIAGTVGDTLVVNLPGSPRGAVECFDTIGRAARHVVDVIAGTVTDCVPPEAGHA